MKFLNWKNQIMEFTLEVQTGPFTMKKPTRRKKMTRHKTPAMQKLQLSFIKTTWVAILKEKIF